MGMRRNEWMRKREKKKDKCLCWFRVSAVM